MNDASKNILALCAKNTAGAIPMACGLPCDRTRAIHARGIGGGTFRANCANVVASEAMGCDDPTHC